MVVFWVRDRCSLVNPKLVASPCLEQGLSEMALEWTAETLRLSLFFTSPVKIGVTDWKTITGQDEPQTIQNTAARRTLSGPFLDGVLQMNVIGPRVDCALLPRAPTATVEEGYIPQVGPLAATAAAFLDATKPWIEGVSDPVHRIAVAGAALAKCDNLQNAYTKLLGMLQSVKGDPARMRELLFRINWPVSSQKMQGLSLNRITTWSVLQVQLQLMVTTGEQTFVKDTPATQVIRLEIDHNTDAERTEPFDRPMLVPIYEELVALALENAEKGEVP